MAVSRYVRYYVFNSFVLYNVRVFMSLRYCLIFLLMVKVFFVRLSS